MAETLIAAGILVLLGFGYLVTRPRKTLAGDMDAPMHLERSRAKSEAEMAAAETDVLPEAEAGEAAALVAYHRELATDEHPLVQPVRRHHVYRGPSQRQLEAMRSRLLAPIRQFEADPLAAPIPVAAQHCREVDFFTAMLDRYATPAIEASSMSFPAPPVEPVLEDDVTFTGSWTGEARRELAALLAADAEAEASR